MRLNLKPAAAAAAAVFLLLLTLDLTWPGHGVWLLVVGILSALASAGLWWRDHELSRAAERETIAPSQHVSVTEYGIRGAPMQAAVRRSPVGVSVSLPLASISALAILLFIGGAIGAAEPAAEPAAVESVAELGQGVSAIDRSRDGQAQRPQVAPPASAQPTTQDAQITTVTTAASADTGPAAGPIESGAAGVSSEESAQTSARVRPIVVAAPSAASAEERQRSNTLEPPASVETTEYTVEEGDTLYEIAERYEATVEAIMALNDLDAHSFIHPGDVLKIPINQEDES